MNKKLAQLLEKLTPAEQKELERYATSLLARRSSDERDQDSRAHARPGRSVLELKGLGKEIWKGTDAQEYVDQERRSWNG